VTAAGAPGARDAPSTRVGTPRWAAGDFAPQQKSKSGGVTARSQAVGILGTVLAGLLLASCGGGGGGGSGSAQLMISDDAPLGTTGVAYPTFTFTVTSGGTAPFTWSETGTLPRGLSLSSTGQLSGTPVLAGTFPVNITVTDSSGLTNSVQLTLKIADSPILISTAPPPPAGTVGCPYAGFTFVASGGSPAYVWTVTADGVPGLTLAPDGSLSGTPTTTGTFTPTVTATDSAQAPEAKSQLFNVLVNPSLNPPLNTPVTTLGGSGAFWIPYQATSLSSPNCGQTGVFVIPSDALTTAPAFVTSSANTMVLVSGLNVTLNGSSLTAYSPATLMFAATDTDNNIHVYGLNLLSPSTPTAIQISSLSLPLAPGSALNTVICDFHGSASNLVQPTTVFVVLHIAGVKGCNTSGDAWEVVHYTDSAAAAPTVVSITTNDIQELYAPSGALTGLVLLDPASKNLYVYADDSFKAPATAIPAGGIASIGTVYSNNSVVTSGAAFTGTVLFLAATTTGGTQYLYRLIYTSTTATNEYTAVGAGTLSLNGVSDGTNLYFTDNGQPQLILQEPLVGGTPTELYSNAAAASALYSLVGSNGSLLVVSSRSSLVTLPVGTRSANTTALVNGADRFLGATMVETTPGTPSTALVFVNFVEPGYSFPAEPPSYSSELLTPSGTVKLGVSANSAWADTSGLSGYVLQIRGLEFQAQQQISIDAINLETLAATVLSNPTGVTLPVRARPFLVPKSNLVGAGSVGADGLAYDLSKDLIVPIVIANTNVAPL
jgi:Putative Ig domain